MGARRIAFFNDTEGSRHFGCTLVTRRVEQLVGERGGEIVWRHPVGKDWRGEAASIPRSPDIDVVIVNGEGSIHHSATSNRARSLIEIGRFARDTLGVPAYLFNATLHEIAEPDLEGLRAFERIFVREGRSRDEMAGAGIEATVVPDLTVSAELARSDIRRGIAVTDSVVSRSAASLKRLSVRNGYGYWPLIYRFRGSPKRWPRLDRNLLKFARVARGSADPVEAFANYVSQHELVVTGRYHAVAYCLATGTPFLAVESNTPKIAGLLDDVFGDRRRLIDDTKLGSVDLSSYVGWGPDEAEQVERFVISSRQKVDAMFDIMIGAKGRTPSQHAPANSVEH